jgi:adenylate kinase
LGTIAAQFIGEGKLVPDPLVLDMLIGRVQRPDCAQGYILDGFPRTVAQAQAFDQRVASSCRLVVFYLEVGDEMLIERIGARIGCNRCGIPYHLRFAPPRSPGVCDECHGPLLQREDDRPDIVRKRLEVYHTQTQPLIEYYQSQGGIFCRIDGAQSKQQVQSDLVAALSSETVLR